MQLVAVDIETSGLDPTFHSVLEVALVSEDGHIQFSLPFDPNLDAFEERALEINGWGRREFAPLMDPNEAVQTIKDWTEDAHLVGKNPWFDASFLQDFLGGEAPWHHRLVDVGCLAWGWYNAHALHHNKPRWELPPNTTKVEEMTGVGRNLDVSYHTALDDAIWAWEVCQVLTS